MTATAVPTIVAATAPTPARAETTPAGPLPASRPGWLSLVGIGALLGIGYVGYPRFRELVHEAFRHTPEESA
jgi:hypothetical protein